jgi:hypothetical protein
MVPVQLSPIGPKAAESAGGETGSSRVCNVYRTTCGQDDRICVAENSENSKDSDIY